MGSPQIPFSNPAGKNQTNPSPVVTGATTVMPGAVPNTGQVPGAVTANPTVPGSPLVTNAQDGGQNALQKQLTDIYGQGVGNELQTILEGLGGTDSATYQQYVASLAPQIAQGSATLNSSLGASGVSANSSVGAIANANYQSGVIATESGADSQIMQQGLQDTIGIVTGTEGAAEQEVAQSGWSVFGKVAEGLGSVAGTTINAAGKVGGFSNLFS